MILVTVGTTMPFAALLEKIDALAAEGFFEDHEVLCQIGKSNLAMENCEAFPFSPSLDNLIARADLVITHGGSTVFSLIKAKKRFVAFPNPIGADQHQHTLLSKLETIFPVLWSADVNDLPRLYQQAMSNDFPDIDLPSLADHLSSFILD